MIPFTKAHACGNDFLIVTEEAAAGHDLAALTRRLCQRNTGIGADGIEFFAWTGPRAPAASAFTTPTAPSPKSAATARAASLRGWPSRLVPSPATRSKSPPMPASAPAALSACAMTNEFAVEVTTGMGVPRFVPHTLKLIDGVEVIGVEVSTGNPHFVVLVEKPDFAVGHRAWAGIGAEICAHRDFPHQTNVEFVRVVSEHEIEIRIFERGVGPTSSSGTGSSAAATAALALRRCLSPLTVVAPGGAQTVAWDGPGTELHLTGPAALIARGEAW